jgi:hypothetical protein
MLITGGFVLGCAGWVVRTMPEGSAFVGSWIGKESTSLLFVVFEIFDNFNGGASCNHILGLLQTRDNHWNRVVRAQEPI